MEVATEKKIIVWAYVVPSFVLLEHCQALLKSKYFKTVPPENVSCKSDPKIVCVKFQAKKCNTVFKIYPL